MRNHILNISGIALAAMCSVASATTMSDDERTKASGQLSSFIDREVKPQNEAIAAAIKKLEGVVQDAAKLKQFMRDIYKEDVARNGQIAELPSDEQTKLLGYARAMQIQCEWGLMTLRAALAENAAVRRGVEFKPEAFAVQLLANLTKYAKEFSELKNNKDPKALRSIMEKTFLLGSFGRVCGVANVRVSDWPSSALDSSGVFKLVMKEPREKKDVSALRSAYKSMIDIATMLAKTDHEVDASRSGDAELMTELQDCIDGKGEEVLTAEQLEEAMRLKELLDVVFEAHELINKEMKHVDSTLRWKCEVECYQMGDQVVAFKNLTSIIQEETNKERKEEMAQQLKELLQLEQ